MQRCVLKDQNHCLFRLLHGQTTSTILYSNCWLELHPLGLPFFVSSCYGGWASDKIITKDCGFYDLLERSWSNGRQEFSNSTRFASSFLQIGCSMWCKVKWQSRKLKSQMTKSEVKKTKEVANLQINVERAINRIKFFRILKGTIPVTMIEHVDDIILICAAWCNLKPKLIKTKENDS